VPVTPPSLQRLPVDWQKIVHLAEDNRPDLIELELIIEADEELLLQANNQALPKLDTVALYRWNGIEGTTPTGDHLGTIGSHYGDWMVGVNFSLPLGLRKERAALRQQKLIVARDYANLDQGLHAAVSDLATSTRNVAAFFDEYKSFQEAREAARTNLDNQLADWQAGRTIFLNVLQAITDWGNAVSAEAQTVTQYNTELATLERLTGTILETHGVHFFEERFKSIGPLGRLAHPQFYPAAMPPGPNTNVYPTSSEPAENTFDLKTPALPQGKLGPPE
jgi:outer membrane protein TolC